MASAHAPVQQAASSAEPRLRRPLDRALLGGVCAGVAERTGLEPVVVRVIMVMLVPVGGIGVAVYVAAWALIPVVPASSRSGGVLARLCETALIAVAVVCVLIATRVIGADFGSRVGDGLWPVVLGVCGMALLWRPVVRGAPVSTSRLSLREYVLRPSRIGAPRLIAGGLFVAFASAALLHTIGVQHSLIKAIWAVVIIATVLSMVAGPMLVRLLHSLSFERAARIREQERAELAAHLHDSVLQTLALIQKRAGDPREVAGLARRQERELRSWLLGRPREGQRDSVTGALEAAAAEIEELHHVPIEVVAVGDAPLQGLEAVVAAAREAMTNAAKFAGSERVDLYAEVDAQRVEVYIRDRGVGFDQQAMPADRRGVRDSIIARMERHGGHAVVHSSPGEGTEVELVMQRGAEA